MKSEVLIVSVALVGSTILSACGATADKGDDATADAMPSLTVVAEATQPSEQGDTLPTPDAQGEYWDVTFEQAQQLTLFELVAPESLPAGLASPSIMLNAPPALNPDAAQPEPDMATMYYEVAGSDPRHGVQFVQRAGRVGSIGTDGETTTVEVNGREVNRTETTNVEGTSVLVYWWQDDDVHRQVVAVLRDGLTEETVEELVAAIPS